MSQFLLREERGPWAHVAAVVAAVAEYKNADDDSGCSGYTPFPTATTLVNMLKLCASATTNSSASVSASQA